jgi:hypothetical protein
LRQKEIFSRHPQHIYAGLGSFIHESFPADPIVVEVELVAKNPTKKGHPFHP